MTTTPEIEALIAQWDIPDHSLSEIEAMLKGGE